MRYSRLSSILFLLLMLAAPLGWTRAPVYEPLRPHLIQRLQLPEQYREMLLRFSTVQKTTQDMVERNDRPKENEILRSWALMRLGMTPEGGRFLAEQLSKEPSEQIRGWIIDAFESHTDSLPAESEAALRQAAATDPNVDNAFNALRVLQEFHRKEVRGLLDKRNALAEASGDKVTLEKLELRYDKLDFGNITLPAFAYRAPAVFAAAPADAPVRVLAFGDFGNGGSGQRDAAAAMLARHKKAPFTLGITLGDNFYCCGLKDPQHPRWRTEWEDMYGPLGIKFYPVFGNHDYKSSDSPAAELAYSRLSSTWVFPAPFYTFTAGAAQFFAVDTVRMLTSQLEWLDTELGRSKAQWKIVYGHYHMYSAGRSEEENLIRRLLPILKKHRVNVYLCGHEHNLQELKAQDGVHFFVIGSGGAELYGFNPDYPRSVFTSKEFGFGALEIDSNQLSVQLMGLDGRILHRRDIVKPQ